MWRRSQVARQLSAKQLFSGSSPLVALIKFFDKKNLINTQAPLFAYAHKDFAQQVRTCQSDMVRCARQKILVLKR